MATDIGLKEGLPAIDGAAGGHVRRVGRSATWAIARCRTTKRSSPSRKTSRRCSIRATAAATACTWAT